jgi:sugar phosphate isomerase/epimerase
MNYAICNETFLDWPFDRAFAFARECGYTGIEIAPFTIATYATDISAARRAEVKKQAAAAGLDVVGLHWLLAKTEGFYLTSPDAAVRKKTSDYLAELVRLCGDLGGSIMVLGSPQQRNLLPGVDKPTAMKYAADVISAALPTFEKCGVTLALEPLGPSEGDFLLTADEGRELAKLINSPHVKLHLDCKAMSSESKPIPEIVRANRDIMVHPTCAVPPPRPGCDTANGRRPAAPVFAGSAIGKMSRWQTCRRISSTRLKFIQSDYLSTTMHKICRLFPSGALLA